MSAAFVLDRSSDGRYILSYRPIKSTSYIPRFISSGYQRTSGTYLLPPFSQVCWVSPADHITQGKITEYDNNNKIVLCHDVNENTIGHEWLGSMLNINQLFKTTGLGGAYHPGARAPRVAWKKIFWLSCWYWQEQAKGCCSKHHRYVCACQKIHLKIESDSLLKTRLMNIIIWSVDVFS